PVDGSTGYKVFQSVTSGTYGTEVTTVSGSVYSYTVTGLTNGMAYYFVVKATQSGVDSAASNERTATPFTVPPAPTNVTAVAGNGQATITFTAPTDNGGSAITGYEVTASSGGRSATGTASPITITGLTNGTSYTFTVKAINGAGSSISSAESNSVVPVSSSGGGDGSDTPSEPAVTPTVPESIDTGVGILVNGKKENAGTATTATRNDQTVTTIVVNPEKLNDKLAAEGQHAVITIPVNSASDVIIGELNGQSIKNMEDKQAVVKIQTDNASYTLPAEQINIDAISGQIGKSVALQDIKVQIEIAAPTADTVKIVQNAAEKGSFTLVVPSVDFTVKATYGDTTVEVSKFTAYVERTIEIPDGVDPNKITTGIVLEADGTVRHVPTQVKLIDGKYYAVINSLTNSTYSVVWHPQEFSDMAKHWAKDAVNDMGSRMVITGTGGGLFSPDRDITRAEFAAIIVRGLGLKLEDGGAAFSDVKATDWYSGAINTARAYGLIDGYNDGTFHPNDKISREQAMTIIAKAMKLTGLRDKMAAQSTEETLHSFGDATAIAIWAKSGVADTVQAGIVSGRSADTLAPKGYMTRAEVATTIQRLLKQSALI
ncbi:MAG: S-layer homology domain-containing protein, partial [Cohnella sp.]|nr:S-layer homology domain-containing protein [Cohnella sp.]